MRLPCESLFHYYVDIVYALFSREITALASQFFRSFSKNHVSTDEEKKDLKIVLSLMMKQPLVLIIFCRNLLALRMKPQEDEKSEKYRRFLFEFHGIMKLLKIDFFVIKFVSVELFTSTILQFNGFSKICSNYKQ